MQIKLDIREKRVILTTSEWSPGLAEDCRAVPGAAWNKNRNCWSYPLSMSSLRELRRVFGQDLVPTPELLAWATEERDREAALRRIGRSSDAKLRRVPKVAPKLSSAMAARTYQKVGARWIARSGSGLIADEPGLGKTATLLAGLIEGGWWQGAHLVSAPKSSLQSTWARQIALWTPDAKYVFMPEGLEKRKEALKRFMAIPSSADHPKFLIVNPAMLRRQYDRWCRKCKVWEGDVKAKKQESYKVRINGRFITKKRKVEWPAAHHIEDHTLKRAIKSEDWPEILNYNWDSVTVDESHDIFSTLLPNNINQSAQGILDINTSHKFALTGTPLRGEERRIWGTLRWFDPVKFKGYWPFIETYFEVADGFFGREARELDPARAAEFGQLIDRYVLRRTRMEVRKDLPRSQRFDIMVEMSPRHEKQYREFERMGEVELESGTVSGQGVLSELTRLKQMAYGMWVERNGVLTPKGDSPKLDKIVEWLHARGVTGKKATDWLPEPGIAFKYVLASQSVAVLNAVEVELNRMKIPTYKIMGSVSQTQRNTYQEKFQSADASVRVMLIQTKTGGVSIELDAWCDEMLILDETFIADDQKQLEGRTENRSGRIAPRSFYYLRTAGTIDQKIAESNFHQQSLQHKLLDGRRGVDMALHLIRGR